jgi:F-type H+-transporting ATPase subunit b
MEIFRSFGIQPVLLLAQIVNFLIILFLLKKFFYKPIIKILEDRKKRIAESLQNAQSIEDRLKKTEEKSAQILDETRKNAQDLIDEAKKAAERISVQAQAESRKTIEQTIAQATKQIESQRLQMQKKLQKETLGLVVEVVKKVLARSLKPKERQDLTTKALSEITKKVS